MTNKHSILCYFLCNFGENQYTISFNGHVGPLNKKNTEHVNKVFLLHKCLNKFKEKRKCM